MMTCLSAIRISQFDILCRGRPLCLPMISGKHQEKLRKAKGENEKWCPVFPQSAFRNSISFVGAGPRACPWFWATTGGCPYDRIPEAWQRSFFALY